MIFNGTLVLVNGQRLQAEFYPLNTTFNGNYTFSGDLSVTGDLTINGDLVFGDAAVDNMDIDGYITGDTNVLRFRDDTNTRGINFTFSAAGNQEIASTAGSLLLKSGSTLGLTIDANGTIFGGTQTSSHALATAGSFILNGLEVNAAAFFDSSITATGGGSLTGTWTDLGSVTTVDINGGTIDGTTIGGSTAAGGTFTTLNATGGGALTGTWSDLGSVTTIDINGGSIDGTTIGATSASSGLFTTIGSTGAITATVNGIATTSTDGIVIQNTTDSTAGVPVQDSPRLRFHHEVWDTDGSNDYFDWKIEATGTSSATTGALFALGYSKNGAAYTKKIGFGDAATNNQVQFYNAAGVATIGWDSNGNQQMGTAYVGFNGTGFLSTYTGGLLMRNNAFADHLSITDGNPGVVFTALATNDGITLTPNGTGGVTITSGKTTLGGAVVHKQGTDIASATTIVVPTDGNIFELTGTTAVNLITTTGFQEGHEITLVANENVTINHATATSGADVTILLAGAGNFAMTANDMLTLVLCSTTAGGQAWREKARTAI